MTVHVRRDITLHVKWDMTRFVRHATLCGEVEARDDPVCELRQDSSMSYEMWSSVNAKSTSNQSSKPCTVLQYPSREMTLSVKRDKTLACHTRYEAPCEVWHDFLREEVETGHESLCEDVRCDMTLYVRRWRRDMKIHLKQDLTLYLRRSMKLKVKRDVTLYVKRDMTLYVKRWRWVLWNLTESYMIHVPPVTRHVPHFFVYTSTCVKYSYVHIRVHIYGMHTVTLLIHVCLNLRVYPS